MPDPDPLCAFAQKVEVTVDQVVMVGDSTHDLIAGQRAGMQTIGVLTGMADAATLAPHADVILPDIGHIPDWLKRA
jgi:phosphoglycolate phosphatase